MERQGAGRPQGWEGSRLEVRDLIIGEEGSRCRPQGWEGSRLEVREDYWRGREQVGLKVRREVGWKLGT